MTDNRLLIDDETRLIPCWSLREKKDGAPNTPLPLLFAPIVTSFYGGTRIENAGNPEIRRCQN